MQKRLVYFNAVLFNLQLSSPERGLLCGYYSRLSRRGAESDETLASIGLLLFSAPNKSQQHLTVYMCVS